MTINENDMNPGTREWITFSPGQVIFREGDAGDVLYVVIDGQVDVIVHDHLIASINGPGGIVGEMALIDAGPRSATAIAKTECTLVPLDKEGFKLHIQKTPDFALDVMQVMSERLRKILQAPSRS